MTWITTILRLIPAVVQLMLIAEKLFDDIPDSGEQKKQYVMTAVKAMVQGITGFTDNDALWKKIEDALGLLVDTACVFLFPQEETTK